jgi:hemoglobin
MIKHLELNRLSSLGKNHFDQWLQLWEETVNENFSGPKSEEAVTRAKAIAELMQYKINTQ